MKFAELCCVGSQPASRAKKKVCWRKTKIVYFGLYVAYQSSFQTSLVRIVRTCTWIQLNDVASHFKRSLPTCIWHSVHIVRFSRSNLSTIAVSIFINYKFLSFFSFWLIVKGNFRNRVCSSSPLLSYFMLYSPIRFFSSKSNTKSQRIVS